MPPLGLAIGASGVTLDLNDKWELRAIYWLKVWQAGFPHLVKNPLKLDAKLII
jgi:hypothetical protein